MDDYNPHDDEVKEHATQPARLTRDNVSSPDTFPQALADGDAGSQSEQAEALESMAHAATLPHEEDLPLGGPHCQRCEVLPRKLVGPGTLHLAMPYTHSLGKVLSWLVRNNLKHSRADGTVAIPVIDGGLGPLLEGLTALMSSTERRDTRAIFQPQGHTLEAVDYFRIDSLTTLAAVEASGWLLDMMRDDLLTTYFQPIVTAGAATEVHGYECLLRGSSGGQLVMPRMIFESARQADLYFQIDMAARRAAVLAAVKHSVRHRLFINFSPNAIYDPTHCLDSTVRMIDDGGIDRRFVVFEVTEAERLPDLHHLSRIVDYYRAKGFGIALDDVGSGYASLNVLLGLRPDYVKLDMNLIRNVDADPAKAVVARKLLEAAQELGLKTVAEGIETREEFEWVRAHGADYVQGYYFARPAAEPAGVAAH